MIDYGKWMIMLVFLWMVLFFAAAQVMLGEETYVRKSHVRDGYDVMDSHYNKMGEIRESPFRDGEYELRDMDGDRIGTMRTQENGDLKIDDEN